MDRQAPLSLGFYSAQSVISLSVCVCVKMFSSVNTARQNTDIREIPLVLTFLLG